MRRRSGTINGPEQRREAPGREGGKDTKETTAGAKSPRLAHELS